MRQVERVEKRELERKEKREMEIEMEAKGLQRLYLRKNGGLQNITDTDDAIYLESALVNSFRAK
ncbi:hypothetical protein EHV15_20835 [Paenibacillus oralis]|uniref:Uncharacterized protein n=1 Tax=Paenibacillus oralis TaxID=2490856 RepID=A0A3P3U695_9BACL|nr:hypothetical protein [Paenibacillus oralis]RRJ65089.1 hypothetical protein EHV15_20835 [Paenibacillus oralis]